MPLSPFGGKGALVSLPAFCHYGNQSLNLVPGP